MNTLKAVIMAGGRGTRFWPLSRRNRPKQFLNVTGRRTLLQETIARLEPVVSTENIFVLCAGEYEHNVSEQIPGLRSENLILEPLMRSTAACIGLAAAQIQERFGDVPMAVLPADHVIGRPEEFHACLRSAVELAREGWLVTFGIRPTFPATGYGYLGRGEEIGQFSGHTAHRVLEFLEKPDPNRAQELVAAGRHDWNSGIFVWTTGVILDNIRRHLPELSSLLDEMAGQWHDRDRLAAGFSRLKSISIDHGVMEKADRVAVIPCDLDWSDVGNWKTLGELLPHDDAGNASTGLTLVRDSRHCVVHGGQKLVALLGVERLIVVDTPDALLICDVDRAEEVKSLVESLEKQGRREFL